MDRRPRVAWDLDDLFHPFIQAVVATINREMGTSYDWRTLPDYEFDVVYGLDSATATRFVNETLAVDGPYHALPFSDEAKAVLRRLSEWIDLGLLTSRKEETLGNITREVIEREVPGVFRFIDLTGNMYAGGVYRQKVDVCRERDYNALVDDLLRHLMPVAADGRLGICFGEYGWNHLRDSAGELLPLPEGIVRAYTLYPMLNECFSAILTHQIAPWPWAGVRRRSLLMYDEATMQPDFRELVYGYVAQIPRGRVMTYGQLAALAGHPRAARQVGGIAHFGPSGLPWHRVVNKQGRLAAGYHGGRPEQAVQLEGEGVEVRDDHIDVASLIWWPKE